MSEEDKNLLLKDLSTRLPYKVKCKIDLQGILDFFDEYREKFDKAKSIRDNLFDTISDKVYTLYAIPSFNRVTLLEFDDLEDYGIPIEFIKPYLRPMSSMTEDENNEWRNWLDNLLKILDVKYPESEKYLALSHSDSIDWLNSHHFDYRGLIEKNLAIEVPEGLYNS